MAWHGMAVIIVLAAASLGKAIGERVVAALAKSIG